MYMAVLHYSLSPDVPASTIDAWHKERGFVPRGKNPLRYIGYHYVIRKDGTVELGRSIDAQPTHCPGYNTVGVLAVCLTGSDDLDWYPTSAQYDSVVRLLKSFAIPPGKIFGHRQLHPTSCPGRLDIRRIADLVEQTAPSEEVEMPRFEKLERPDLDGMYCYGCARLIPSNLLYIHAEGGDHDYKLEVFGQEKHGRRSSATDMMVGGWGNRDGNYGGIVRVKDLFDYPEVSVIFHSPVPLAVEVL